MKRYEQFDRRNTALKCIFDINASLILLREIRQQFGKFHNKQLICTIIFFSKRLI